MKTKFLLSFVLIAILGLLSCEKIQEVASVKVDTDINIEVPLESAAASIVSNESNLKSSQAAQSFAGTGTFNLSSISGLEEYIDGINNVDIRSGNAEITGLSGDQEITTLNFKMKRNQEVVFEFSIPNALKNGSSSFAVSNLADLSSALTNYTIETFQIEVSGTSNFTLSSTSNQLKTTFGSQVKYFPL